MLEIRGISIAYTHTPPIILITTRAEKGDDYTTLVFPDTLPLNEGQVRKFLGDHFGIEPGKIVWPPHIKIPKV